MKLIHSLILSSLPLALANTVYVDCSASASGDGSQSNPYNSIAHVTNKTLNAGDSLLFKSGTICKGQLSLNGTGTAAKPITLSSYGSGSLPIINGDGVVGAAVSLSSVDYWTINRINVSNPASVRDSRQGISVFATDNKDHHGITITETVVDDVAGWTDKTGANSGKFSASAGIVFGPGAKGGSFSDVQIFDNFVTNSGGGGMKIRVGYGNDRGKNVHIYNNTVTYCGGDGILANGAESPLIDYNEVSYMGLGKYPWTGGNFAAVWVIQCANAVMRYNVVWKTSKSSFDSEAFDCDWGNTGTCTVEYNYSHDNYGGAYLNCDGCGSSGGATQIVRYNIFENDCRMISTGDAVQLNFYNNVMYCTNNTFNLAFPKRTNFSNNIIVGNNKAGTFPTHDKQPGLEFHNNIFYNFTSPVAAGVNGTILVDPQLVNAGLQLTTLDYGKLAGYKVKSGSKALSAGTTIANNGGVDFFGNSLPGNNPNIGVYQGNGV